MTPPTPLELARRITEALEDLWAKDPHMCSNGSSIVAALSDSRALVQMLEKDAGK